jgi:hypothetical protein
VWRVGALLYYHLVTTSTPAIFAMSVSNGGLGCQECTGGSVDGIPADVLYADVFCAQVTWGLGLEPARG